MARRAGVSTKTVSRVLNAEPYVRDELKARVLSAARDLHYRPKMSARSLPGSRSYVVGYLLNDPSNPYIGQAQLGALTACRQAGYHLLVESIDLTGPDIRAQLDRWLGALKVDGVLLSPPLCDNANILGALDDAGVAYVRLAPSTDPRRSPLVESDDRAAAHQMALHLIDLGHRDIGFVVGAPGHSASRLRLEGFRSAMADRGLPFPKRLIRQGDFTFRSGGEAGDELLRGRLRPTAIFASNDAMALGVMATAHKLGLSVPGDLSVAGFDDLPWASVVWPKLTTVRQPIMQMAAMATGIIIDLSAGNLDPAQPQRRMLHSEIVVRASTAPPANPGGAH